LLRNIPNLFTAARLALVPFIALAIVRGRFPVALALTFAAGVTDAFDGLLARRFGWTSRAGAYLDPIADKLLLVTLFIALGYARLFPWWLVELVVGRDLFILAMVGAGFALTRIRDFPPTLAGKLSTIIQVGACVGVLLLRTIAFPWPSEAAWMMIATTAAATVWSGFDYARRGLTMLRTAPD
jgi:cardiolipin synthase